MGVNSVKHKIDNKNIALTTYAAQRNKNNALVSLWDAYAVKK